MIDHVFDIVICALLVATIMHLALVQRRLSAFRAERDRLQAFVTALDLTVERAEAAIRRMRTLEAEGAKPPPEQPRPVRQRSPDELLRAARLAAGVDGKPKPRATADDGQARPRASAAAIADALGTTLGG